MSEETKAIEIENKQELAPEENAERTRECQCYVPRADIYETENEVVVVTDMPGVDQDSIEITLEKSTLTINGYVEPDSMEGYALAHVEYSIGDFERRFTISNEIDRENIEATIKDGVLRLVLPKAGPAKTRKISVKSGK